MTAETPRPPKDSLYSLQPTMPSSVLILRKSRFRQPASAWSDSIVVIFMPGRLPNRPPPRQPCPPRPPPPPPPPPPPRPPPRPAPRPPPPPPPPPPGGGGAGVRGGSGSARA